MGLNPDDAIRLPTVSGKNLDRLIDRAIADAFSQVVLQAADRRGPLSHAYFSVDGSFHEAWASHERVRTADDPSSPSDGDPRNRAVNVRGEKCTNATPQSVTDPDTRLARSNNRTASIVGHFGGVLVDNHHGLIVATDVRALGCDVHRDVAVEMLTTLGPRKRRRTLGEANGYDSEAMATGARAHGVTPQVAQIHPRDHVDECY